MTVTNDQAIRYWFRETTCEECGTKEGVKLRPSMTSYHCDYEKIEPDSLHDPNGRMGLCEACYEDYKDFWDSMWAEVNSSY
jgi:hypothetical protein